MLKSLSHLLGYLSIHDALLHLENRNRKEIFINRRLVPESTYLMRMGLDWDVSHVRQFFELSIRYHGLQRQLFCKIGQGDVDFVVALRSVAAETTANNLSAAQAACTPYIPICLVMIQHGPGDDPVLRLRRWLPGHLDWLRLNHLCPNGECQPVPYFLLDNDKWKVGFAMQSGCYFSLYDEFIGSMGWRNGVRKFDVILRLVIESEMERHRQLVYGRSSQDIPSASGVFQKSE